MHHKGITITLLFTVFFFSLGIAVAQNTTQNQTSQTVCSGTQCNPNNNQQICSNGQWVNCPSGQVCSNNVCTSTTATPTPVGNATPVTPTPAGNATPQCPPPPACAAPPANCNYNYTYDNNGCLISCGQLICAATPACPVVSVPSCTAGTALKTTTDANGCPVYSCITVSVCPTPPQPPTCAPDETLSSNVDSSGCVTGYTCNKISTIIAVCGNNVCELGEADTPGGQAGTCPQDCKAPPSQCGNFRCEQGEENICPSDCISARPTCPQSIQCFDGSTALCRQTDFGCDCDQCPIPQHQLPPGCRQIKDDHGFIRVECEHKRICEPIHKDAFDRCREGGGRPITRVDPSGCNFFDCIFTDRPITNPIVGATKCPTPEEVDANLQKCSELGVPGFIAFEGGCKIARCVEKEEKCDFISEKERIDIENQCREKGLNVLRDFDNNACPILRCGEIDECRKEPPQELFKKCGEHGGSVVIRRDHNACIVFADCVTRGDERDAFIEKPKRIPDASELLLLALKLEKLKIQLNNLAEETGDIAEFYKSRDEAGYQRFARVSSMFETAMNKIDEIKNNIRDIAKEDDIDEGDIVEVRHDIRYIKDVLIKDILLLMLGDEHSDVKDIEEKEEKDCGTDGECFDRAFRVCKSVTFKPEGDYGPTIEVTGIENDLCVLKVSMPEEFAPPAGSIPGVNPPYEMTCKVPNYSLGVRGPEDVIPHCTGNMVELMKQFGGPAAATGHEFPPPEGGPGGCRSIQECSQYCLDQYDKCVQWTKEHPAYGSPPSREELQRYASSEFKPPQVSRARVSGPGGCSSPEECNEFCSQPENFDECSKFAPRTPPQIQPSQRGYPPQPTAGPPQSYPQPPPGYRYTKGSESCVGCFDNGVCDPSECSFCKDCGK